MKKGDKVVALNGKAVDSYNEFTNEVGRMRDMLAAATTHSDSVAAMSATVTFVRVVDGRECRVTQKTLLTDNLEFGFAVPSLLSYYKPTHVSYGFFECFPAECATDATFWQVMWAT